MSNLTITLSEEELATAISGLLFSCSVNVVSETSSEYQFKLLELAKKFKSYKEDIKIPGISFVKEDSYEDGTSADLLNAFKGNIEITTFDNI